MALIAVDMTPVLPGGKNGGAKILAIELLKSFQKMAPEHKFLLLTSSWNHDELAILDGFNMNRLCILKKPFPDMPRFEWIGKGRAKRVLLRFYLKLKQFYRSEVLREKPLKSNNVDLLFCPFTATTYAEPDIPVVSVILDLQHVMYPWFFSSTEVEVRNTFYKNLRKRADRIICISEYVRLTVLKFLNTKPEKTFTIPICIQNRFKKIKKNITGGLLRNLGINKHPYIFYPANFWPHKNHKILLTAYGMYLNRNPYVRLDLVFTGGLDSLQAEVKAATKRMNLDTRVHFLGYLPEDQLYAVWQGCEFLIFPSLYEGFGIPLLEAMSLGKPIACSNGTSLPEVAGDAAVYFDPRKPQDIAESIEKIVSDPNLKADLVTRGHRRVKTYKQEDMALNYLKVLNSAIKDSKL